MKRAQAASGLVLAFGAITIAIITVFFLLIIQDNTTEKKQENIERDVDDQVTLLNYLRTPANIEYNMADLIMMYVMTEEQGLKELIDKKTKEILNPLFELRGEYWKIKVNGEQITQMKDPCPTLRSIEQEIMTFKGERVKVELVFCG